MEEQLKAPMTLITKMNKELKTVQEEIIAEQA